MSEPGRTTCPHCGATLAPLAISEAFFEHAHDLACFNDDCPYYVRGWAWMERQFGVRSSYRYRVDAQTGQASPLAVFFGTGLRTGALPLEEPGASEEHP